VPNARIEQQRPAQRSRFAALGSATVLLAALLNGSLAVPVPVEGAQCALVPQFRDITINQGLGSYTKLVQGKETLLRAYLSLPSCASSTATIALKGGSVTVTGGGIMNTVQSPFPIPSTPFPLITPYYKSTPPVDSVGDPKFVIPGSFIDPSGSASYTATFSITIVYRASGATADSFVTFTKMPGTTVNITKIVEQDTHPLRVLVVPMGDATKSYATQYSATANEQLQLAMQTLSRVYPVPDGTGDLTSTTGGIRYTVLPTLLDIHNVLEADGSYCMRGSSFDIPIKGQLATFAQTWERANPGIQIDVAVAVVDAAISNGTTCAQGLASVGSAYTATVGMAAVRLTPDQAGATMAMEVGHALGLVPTARGRAGDPSHSPFTAADAGSNRGYDVRDRSFLADDRTAMYFSGAGYTNTSVLAEQLDYAFLLCALGGSTATDCSNPGAIGDSLGGPRFVLTGTVAADGQSADVAEAYSFNVPATPPGKTGPFVLLQIGAHGVLRTDFVPVVFGGTHHETPASQVGAPVRGVVDVAVPFNPDAIRVEFRNTTGNVLLDSFDTTTTPPTFTQTQVLAAGPTNYTNDATVDDQWSAISPDGRWVAWTVVPSSGFSRIHVAPIGNSAADVTLTDASLSTQGQSQPAWRPDSRALAFASSGDLVTVDVNTSGATPTFSNVRVVYDYDSIYQTGLFVSHPSWSPDSAEIAFDADGAIFTIPAAGTTGDETQLTFTGDASNPSWSQTPGDDRIAYQRDAPQIVFAPTFVPASYVKAPRAKPAAPALPGGNVFTVNSTNDVDDGTCDATHCSLREAINVANSTTNASGILDEIDFAISPAGSATIQPASALPTITDPVFIDGFSQPGSFSSPEPPHVEIDGSSAGAATNGLTLTAGGSVVQGLVINRFFGDGISISGPGNNVVQGNYIGTNLAGTTAAGNGASGVEISDSPSSTIGGTDLVTGTLNASQGNVISGNAVDGIRIGGSASSGNTVLGNYIGTNAAGSGALANIETGVNLRLAGSNTVGGTAAGARNVISGNASASSNGTGVQIIAGGPSTVAGNYIGTNAAGTAALPNDIGVLVSSSLGNTIGAYSAAGRNVISGNNLLNVFISGSSSTGNHVIGNYVGPDKDGAVALGNADAGIRDRSPNNFFGDDVAGAGNVISGNAGPGIDFAGDATGNPTGNVVQRNLIGVAADGTSALPNNGPGIALLNGSNNNDIGGSPDDGNVIANNAQEGVDIGAGTGSAIQGNSIYSNGALGIDLAPFGVTANDAGDTDSGANDLQNFPVLTSASFDGSQTTVNGTLDTTAGVATYEIEVFKNTACDAPSGHGEGKTLIHSLATGTDASGHMDFSFLTASAATGDVLTATATNPAGSTSEFSTCLTVTGAASDPPSWVVNVTDDKVDPAGCTVSHCSLREAINRANSTPNGSGPDEISFNIPNAPPHVITLTSRLPSIVDPVVIDATTEPGYGGAGHPVVALDGSALHADTDHGFYIPAGGTTIRGLAIGGFGGAGIYIDGTDTEAGHNVIDRNYIGSDATGSVARGNAHGGLIILTSSVNVIGGTNGDENVIVGNTGDGIVVDNGANNDIVGNLIGVVPQGSGLVMGNSGAGIHVDGSADTLIGGDNGPSQSGNLIGGNAGAGILLVASSGTQVLGNAIGTGTQGVSDFGNGGPGVEVRAGNSTTNIGSDITSEANFIAFNAGDGISVVSSTGITIRSNSIDKNGSLGIDLGADGPTTNDEAALDADTGANELQNFPDLAVSEDGTTVDGVLRSAANTTYGIELFKSAACDPSHFGEGDESIDEFTVTTNASGYAQFSRTVSAVASGEQVTGTATDPAGNTSEFSVCAQPEVVGSEVWTLDPDAPASTQERLAQNAAEPSWGANAAIAVVRDSHIWTVNSDGTGAAQQTTGTVDDAMPSLGSVLAFTRAVGTQDDVFLLNKQIEVRVTAAFDPDSDQDHRKLDLLYTCPGSPNYDVAVAVKPEHSDATSSSWRTNYDPSIACPNGTLKIALIDGFNVVAEPGAGHPVTTPDTGPVAAIYVPEVSDTLLEHGALALHGSGHDAKDGDLHGTSLRWFVGAGATPPEVNYTSCNASRSHCDLQPPGGHWPVGPLHVRLQAIDSNGATAFDDVTITVLADADNDGIPATVDNHLPSSSDTQGCSTGNTGGDSNPLNAFFDTDRDGYSNAVDYSLGDPCVAATSYPADVLFSPDTLYVPSSGTQLTMTVQPTLRDLKTVSKSSVKLHLISGQVVDIPNVGWGIDKTGVGIAKFDRQVVINKLIELHMVGTTTQFTISGTSTQGWSFEGTDGADVKPAN
jgi:CSLREA domain-containing protein